jgi:hypothetical protein
LVVGGPARVGHVRRQNTVIEHQASPADAAHTPVRIDARVRKRQHVASHARRFLASHRTNNTVRTTSNQAHRGMHLECSPGLADTSARSPRLCCDSGNCELPARGVELGETAATAAERKVVEECGVAIKVTRLAGIFTDPGRHGLPRHRRSPSTVPGVFSRAARRRSTPPRPRRDLRSRLDRPSSDQSDATTPQHARRRCGWPTRCSPVGAENSDMASHQRF